MRSSIFISIILSTLTAAHTIITYPGWRGDNLITNDEFPYGMQWMYPCELSSILFSLKVSMRTSRLTTE